MEQTEEQDHELFGWTILLLVFSGYALGESTISLFVSELGWVFTFGLFGVAISLTTILRHLLRGKEK